MWKKKNVWENPGRVYWKKVDIDCDLINENISIISEASDHSRIVAFTYISKVFDFVWEKHNLPPEVTLHIWSDKCAGQSRSDHDMFLIWFLK